MDVLEQSWFEAAERDSLVAAELEALADQPAVDFTRLKVGLGCMVAAIALMVLPLVKPAPRAVAAPAPMAVRPVAPAKPAVLVAAAPKLKAKAAKPKSKPRHRYSKALARN